MKVTAKGFNAYLSDLQMADADEMARLANDREMSRGLATEFPYPYDRNNAVSFIESATELMMRGIGFHLAIRRASDGAFLGVIGAEHNPLSKRCKIGFWLGKEHWGKGYGKEAAKLMLHLCFTELEANRVVGEVHTFNERSMVLLSKLGFKKEGILRQESFIDGVYVDDVVLSILKEEYKDISGVQLSR